MSISEEGECEFLGWQASDFERAHHLRAVKHSELLSTCNRLHTTVLGKAHEGYVFKN